jgi:hypothetical protein
MIVLAKAVSIERFAYLNEMHTVTIVVGVLEPLYAFHDFLLEELGKVIDVVAEARREFWAAPEHTEAFLVTPVRINVERMSVA